MGLLNFWRKEAEPSERKPQIGVAANDSLAQKVLEVGDRLEDGTVCIHINLYKNKALFAPAGIIGGYARLDYQSEIPAWLNKKNAHGHNDWRNITRDERDPLCEVWDKVALGKLKGSDDLWCWFDASRHYDATAKRATEGSYWTGHYLMRMGPFPIPCVRSGPVRS